MKLILSTINGAGANKIFRAPAPAPQKYLKRLQLQLRLLQNWLAPWLHAPAPHPWLQAQDATPGSSEW